MLTEERLRAKPFAPSAPHVVILGAGASRAAIPSGDKNGKPIPLLDDIPNILGDEWFQLVADAQPPPGGFESQFSWIRKDETFGPRLADIEKAIEHYFSSLELPEYPTIYDYLVLGLRPKDVIATFNWDPLLMQAVRRNRNVIPLPDIRFLHGSVAFTTCPDHDVLGSHDECCPICHCELRAGRLIFPDSDKDYARDAVIRRNWEAVTNKIKKAFHLTIFGYSGPATDYKARKILEDGWRATPMRDFSHAEIIDVKEEEALLECWREFFPHQHDIKTSATQCGSTRRTRSARCLV